MTSLPRTAVEVDHHDGAGQVRGAAALVPGDPLVAFSPYAKGLTTGEISAHFAELDPGQYLQGHDLPDH